MSPTACFFLWNDFSRDARVTREIRSLLRDGWRVRLVCTEGADTYMRGLRVTRVKETPRCVQNAVRGLKRHAGKKSAAGLLCRLALRIGRALFVRTRLARACRGAYVIAQMVRAGLRTRADVYQSNDLNTLLQGACCTLRKDRKLIYDSHEVCCESATYRGRFYALLERALIGRADEVILTTAMRAARMRQRYGIPMPHVVRNCPETREAPGDGDALRAAAGLPPGAFVFLYQGGLQAGRGIEQILEAARLVKEAFFVFLGEGKEKDRLRETAARMGLKERARFVDAVPYERLHGYTAQADAGLQVLQNTCFNHYSAVSNKLLEYVMAGLPVIASDFPEMRKIVEGEGVGVVVRPDDARAIAAAADRLLRDRAFYDACQKNALAARAKYNWEKEQKLYVGIYGKYKNG